MASPATIAAPVILADVALAGGLALYVGAMLRAAWTDFTSMRITNRTVLAVLAAFAIVAPAAWLGGHVEASILVSHVLVGIVALVAGYALFAFGVFGGGDGKLIAAAFLVLGGAAAGTFLLAICLAGGVLCAVLFGYRAVELPPAIAGHPVALKLHERSGKVPYGVAIAPAAVLALFGSTWAPVVETLVARYF